MSTDFTVPFQRKAEAKLCSDGEVAIAAIWLALFLLMVVGVLFENQNKPTVPLVFLAVALAGLGLLGWRRKKRAAALAA
jgi:LPXTG-motif cell wall-anchored protein